ncbi:phosphoenolpyruvate--protein phosphotransferase [Anaerotruncus rubiinfantis]|uniref:phosphoenolpyruvate--protein phosphotransferase n=1 Tax=Anaerotruncus rubiinfantis TaxID=1720200 RepID=UPI001897007F|nr:phosphoenolpyruvate--protein phosphotransferase [Anaerotruncus rubiinfantis]
MRILKGVGASRGIAIGRIFFFDNANHRVQRRTVTDAEEQLARFESARREAVRMLALLEKKALGQVGPEESAIFGIHQMLIEDCDYTERVTSLIRTEGYTAEYAVQVAGEQLEELFKGLDDPYMQARGADMEDVTVRIVRTLTGESDCALPDSAHPAVVAARDLLPSETIRLGHTGTLAYLTSGGSGISHSAILARTMEIPAVVGLGEQIADVREQELAIVDGFTGTVVLSPDDTTLAEYTKKQAEYRARRERLKLYKGTPNRTADGITIQVDANLGHTADLGAALENDADGVGLLRTEFLFREETGYADEQTQFAAYRAVAEGMDGGRVVVRTFDPDPGKMGEMLGLPKEENPALGCRGIRFLLRRTDLLYPQLRALLRASAYGNLAVLLPMVSSVAQVRQVKEMLAACRRELAGKQIPFSDKLEVGVLIETPAAALLSGQLAREADFFSIGTNDLIQYTLAVGRQDNSLRELYDPSHPAVLHLVEMAAAAAAENGIWCGICGEAAADPGMTETFLALGVTELSVTPQAILEIREKLQSVDLSEARRRVHAAH